MTIPHAAGIIERRVLVHQSKEIRIRCRQTRFGAQPSPKLARDRIVDTISTERTQLPLPSTDSRCDAAFRSESRGKPLTYPS